MNRDLEKIVEVVQGMVDADKERDRLFAGIDDMIHFRWNLPTAIRNLQWVKKFVTSDPYDAVNSTRKVFASVAPKIKYYPLASTQANKDKANEIERSLSWWLQNASRRGNSKIVDDIVSSAARYDEVTCQVVHLDTQARNTGMSSKSLRQAKRNGPFAVLVRNPRNVHSQFSEWGMERVCEKKVMDTKAILAFWGDKAKKLLPFLNDEKNPCTTSVLVDFWDLEQHAVWVIPGSEETGKEPVVIMPPTEHGLDFIPWVVKVGGTNLDESPEYNHNPLLYSAYRTGQWVNRNVIETLVNSEAISHAAAPRLQSNTFDGEGVDIEYGAPDRQVALKVGESAGQMVPPPIDQGLLQIGDRLSAAMSNSSVPRVLQNAEFPSGTSFALMNLATQSAVKSINPVKSLSEGALADICRQMLYWIDYAKVPETAMSERMADEGMRYVVSPDDFDPENCYISVELTADIPTDRLSRMNAAALGVERLGYSREAALEDIGVEDPQNMMRQSFYEGLLQNEIQIAMQNAQMSAQMKWQMLQQQMQMQMQAQQEASMQGGTGQLPNEQPTQGIPGATGQGYNPAMGGTPPAMLEPEGTREMQAGSDNQGLPVGE
jgi:hypothetical protein